MTKQKKSFPVKVVIAILIAFAMLITGSLAMVLVIGLLSEGSIMNGLSNLQSGLGNGMGFKIGFAFNHLIIFLGTGLLLGLIFKEQQQLKDYFNIKSGWDWSLIWKAIACILLSYPVAVGMGHLISQLPLPDWASNMDDERMNNLLAFMEMNSVADFIANLMIVAVIAGVGEELLFRGVVQKEIEDNYGKPLLAITVTAFLFAIMHMEVSGLPAKFLLGFVFGVTYWVSRSLKYTMLLHVINNAMPLILIYASGQSLSDLDSEPEIQNWQAFVMLGIFVPLLVLGVRQLLRHKDTESA